MKPQFSLASIFTLLLGSFLSFSSFATFLPENEIRYETLSLGPSNISQSDFNQLIADVQKVYEPIVSGVGGKLSISGNWRDEKANAGAAQMFGTWRVQISGGLARRPELTADGFTLILCHELGHHLGGFAFGQARSPFEGTWAANEGQSDYFAAQVCSRKLWGAQVDKNQEFKTQVVPFAREKCDQVWQSEDDRNLCYRVTVATESVIRTMAALKGEPMVQFNTPDTKVVEKTSDAHPATQCRMDTSFQAALCPAFFDEKMIPGKSAPGGVFGIEAEREAASSSCAAYSGYSLGLRPLCWFKPRL